VPVDLLCKWLDKAIDAQKQVGRRPEGWHPLETFLHLGCACSTIPVDGVACHVAQATQGVLFEEAAR
jgi:hypothetical protein